jgi:plastocyanin domain-containing protein
MQRVLFSLVCAASLLTACNKPSSDAAPAASAAAPLPGRHVAVVASKDGYEPATIEAKKGESLVLDFKRTSKGDCLAEVVFPTLGIKKDLPLDQTVQIPVKAEQAGDLKFQCGMAMVFGKIHVAD